ncbi:adenine-specific methyltransferase EcoRI family protein [Mycoplasmopsis felis]|uniref:adenine-specific methyltransferase EcoRI family protein n=1 Tax=Mycoplasmopsis felis TaxID=33923 RepID=UPI002AFDD626|nr:adenine-specific methyltransferase EcoRI family protein [Mycoplasmopsis felis]WQQ06661.1 adenine-specific methyltransferase EcoRI family protein [Mycoplasmopsis felis]
MNLSEALEKFKKDNTSLGSYKLINASKNKNDEFYSTYEFVEHGMNKWREFFKGQIIYLPCDDLFLFSNIEVDKQKWPSNYWIYFKKHFKELGLKKLIATSWNETGNGLYAQYLGSGDDSDVFDGVELREMTNNGDMFLQENKKYFEECDWIITNPPFSKLSIFYPLLKSLKKNFLINAPITISARSWGQEDYKKGELFYYADAELKKSSFIDARKLDNYNITYGGPHPMWISNIDNRKAYLTKGSGVKKYECIKLDDWDNDKYCALDKFAHVEYHPDKEWFLVPVTAPIHNLYFLDDWEICCSGKRGSTICELSNEHRKEMRVNGKHKYARLVIRRRKK